MRSEEKPEYIDHFFNPQILFYYYNGKLLSLPKINTKANTN